MAVTKTPFLAKHGLTANEDSNFVKSVFIAGTLTINGSASMKMPIGTTANRETGAAAVNGLIRYNSTTNNFEGLAAGDWVVLGGNQSVKSAAYQKIELIAAAAGLGHEVIAGDDGMRVYRDVVGFSDTSTAFVGGAMIIKLPYATATSHKMTLVGGNSNNASGYSIELYAKFTGTAWTGGLAVITGYMVPYTTIRLGVMGGLPVVIIGPESANTQPKPQLLVQEYVATKAGVANDWYKGWSITMSSDISSVSGLVNCIIRQVYDSTNMQVGPALAALSAPSDRGREMRIKTDGSGSLEYSGGYDPTIVTNFTALTNMVYHLSASNTVTLPSTGLFKGAYVGFTKSYSATPTIQSTGGANIKAGTKTDTSVTFDVNAQITFIFNGTDWEV